MTGAPLELGRGGGYAAEDRGFTPKEARERRGRKCFLFSREAAVPGSASVLPTVERAGHLVPTGPEIGCRAESPIHDDPTAGAMGSGIGVLP
jgi:hypothetical protein